MENLLIVGATSDIAIACADLFAARGTNLILAGRDEGALQSHADRIREVHGVTVHVRSFEALDFDSHQRFFDDAAASVASLDGILLAHGYLGEQMQGETEWPEARRILDINYTSVVSILNLAGNHFEQKKSGFIGAISSVAGDRGRQSNYLYGSAKGGLSVYLQGLRNRLHKHNVHVLTVKPGFVETKMTEHLASMPLAVKPHVIAKCIHRAWITKKSVIYTPGFWRYIMWVIKAVPERIFKRLNL